MSGIEITAADREAMCVASTDALAPHILRGDWDDTRSMHAFAQHRIQARNAALEEAEQLALGYADMCDGSENQIDIGATHAAAAIAECLRELRALSTQDTPDMRATNKGDA